MLRLDDTHVVGPVGQGARQQFDDRAHTGRVRH
jgi:hypothetical protein